MDDDAATLRPRRWPALAGVLGVVSLVAVAAGVSSFLGHRVVERGTAVRALVPDGRRVVVRRLGGPADTPEGELQLRDAGLAVIWRVPYRQLRAPTLHLARDAVIVRNGTTLAAYELETGARRWEVPFTYSGEYEPGVRIAVLDDEVLEILEESYGPGLELRMRSLATGALRWQTAAPPMGADDELELRWYAGDLYLDLEHAIDRVDLETGTIDPLAHTEASSICATTDEAIYVAGNRLWLRPTGGEPRELGHVEGGVVACARAEGRIWITWDHRYVGRSDDFEPRRELALLTAPRGGAELDGALFVLGSDGSFLWGLGSGWGAPDLDIVPPGRGAWRVPRARPGQLVVRFEESYWGGEEIGSFGGRTAEVVVDESTGTVL